VSVLLVECVVDNDFYVKLAQSVRDMAENADPFTRKRLLDLAVRYDAKVDHGQVKETRGGSLPPSRITQPALVSPGPNKY
jgi:hypothetical protein